MVQTTVAVGRQPIVDRTGDVVGYELLYRSPHQSLTTTSGEAMTAEVVLGALAIGVNRLVGDKSIFCNAERGVLTGSTPVTLPPDRTVIEVLETVDLDDEAVRGCADLVARGFRLALDDFVWRRGAPQLLELASIVKVDILATGRAEAELLVERCRPFGVKVLAEKVQTEDDVAWAREVGFDLFQGYAIERPQVVRSRTIPSSTLAQAQLAIVLLADDFDLDELEVILRREPGLVLQVLQMASAGADHGLRREIRTIRAALVLLGTVRVRQWAALVLLAGRSFADPDRLAPALVRARAAELLARHRGEPDAAFAFAAGLLSSVDLLLGVDPRDAAAMFDVPQPLAEAAFCHLSPTGELVAEVATYQDAVTRRHEDLPATVHLDVEEAVADAFAWAMPYVNSIGGSAA